MSGLLISCSGLDGAGKSTQIEMLQEQLRAVGKPTIYLWSRGGYTPGMLAIKKLLRHFGRGGVIPQSGHSEARTNTLSRPHVRRLWLILSMLDLLWLYGLRVRWWRWTNRTVICDRYLYDTLVDFRLNFPQESVERWPLWHLLTRLSPQSDVALLLLIPVDESLRRSRQKNEPFPDSCEVLTQRLEAYQRLVNTGKWLVLDGTHPVESVATQIWRALCAVRPALESAVNHAN